nr:SRPBCC domain-containing protein [Mammaliicoccus sp. Marseille-Q6498]
MSEQNGLEDIVKSVELDAPIETVWEVVTTSEGVESWWMANTLEPELDNHFVLHAGPYGDSECKVTKYEPPHEFQFDWGDEWQATFKMNRLSGDKTEFTLIHAGWVKENSSIHKIMNDGWNDIIYERLPEAIKKWDKEK